MLYIDDGIVMAQGREEANTESSPVILWFDLKQIATQTLSTVSSTEKCPL